MRLHFIGIGGIGVSALAQYYLATGHKISGSDLASSEIIKFLQKKGAKIFIGHSRENLTNLATAKKFKWNKDKIIIYSPAVKEDNPELKEARKLGIKCQSYPEALGELTKRYFSIAVAGTHGKSTTTAMLALILIRAGLDPTVIVGTKLREFGNSNFRMGDKLSLKIKKQPYGEQAAKLKILIIEACEHEASFLNYWPKIIVITNIEKEHLDYYKNLKNILKAFKEFVGHLPRDGILVLNKDDKNILRTFGSATSESYWLGQKEVKTLRKILKVPGQHNVYNALAALTVARALKIPDKISFKVLSEYKGSWRRFEEKNLKIKNLKLKIIQDYAHHPTEIKATLQAARERFPGKEIWCVFQPHQHQRTHYLFKDFVRVFREALDKNWIDKLIITDIYDVAGRGDKSLKKKVSSKMLAEKTDREEAIRISTLKQTEEYLKKNLKGREAVIIMGAGDVYNLLNLLKSER